MKPLSNLIALLFALTYLTYATYILIALWAHWAVSQQIITIGAMSGYLALSALFFQWAKD